MHPCGLLPPRHPPFPWRHRPVWLLAVLLLAVLLLADSSTTVETFKVALARGESLSVETAGTGDPVVLIPGLFGSAFGFRNLVPLLTQAGYRAIVIEPLGIGSSARPEKANYSLTAQADRIAAVLDSLGVRGALLIAHSIGGSEAFRLAYRRPDLVKGLLSIEGGPTEAAVRSEEHTSELQSPCNLVCRLLLEKKKNS